MMRARSLKPSFFKNEYLGALPIAARYLFTGLWCLADRDGRLEDRPVRIKGEIFPYENQNVSRLLDALCAPTHDGPGFITRYQVNGKRYIQIHNFTKHQNPHHREPESTIPSIIAGITEASEIPVQASELPGLAVLTPDSPFLTPDSGLLTPEGGDFSPADLATAWNTAATSSGLRPCRALNAKRSTSAQSRLRENHDAEYWQTIIDRISRSSFCRGENARGWVANFDWLVRPDTHLRVLEGQYDNTSGLSNPKTQGNIAALSRFVAAGREVTP